MREVPKKKEQRIQERKEKKIHYYSQRSRPERFKSYVEQRKLVSFTFLDHRESTYEFVNIFFFFLYGVNILNKIKRYFITFKKIFYHIRFQMHIRMSSKACALALYFSFLPSKQFQRFNIWIPHFFSLRNPFGCFLTPIQSLSLSLSLSQFFSLSQFSYPLFPLNFFLSLALLSPLNSTDEILVPFFFTAMWER